MRSKRGRIHMARPLHTPGKYRKAMSNNARLYTAVLRLCALAMYLVVGPPGAGAWGEFGHRISGKAASINLPSDMPAFFRNASAQLEYLNPEPDRWREQSLSEMSEAFRYDHYIDLEVVPAAALSAQDRY